eukprot:g450.t1
MPKCRPATNGCKYVKDSSKKENGCPQYPCGRMECEADDDDDEKEEETEEEDQNEEQEDPHDYEGENQNEEQEDPHNYEGEDQNEEQEDPHNYEEEDQNEEQEDPQVCKNVFCKLALCQPGQTTVPANPVEGKCCNSCEGEADLSVKCDHVMCSMAICQPGQTTVFADPKKGRCCNTCEGEPDDTLKDGPEKGESDDDEIDENYKIIGGNVYCLAPSADDAIEHQHAEMHVKYRL